jgi:hypothetical protein
MILSSRRQFIAGLFVAPAIIPINNLMKIRKVGEFLSQDHLLLRYKVWSKETGLILSLSKADIIKGGDKYMPFLEILYKQERHLTREDLGIDGSLSMAVLFEKEKAFIGARGYN